MKTRLLITKRWLPLVLLAAMAGCTVPPTAANKPAVTDPGMTPQNFQEPYSEVPNAVESAIELSQKCAELSEQITALREEKFNLTTENEKLKTQIAELEPKLERAQTELGEANDLLIEMRLELNNWQDNILGFRSEMRDADQAQLDALLKILQLLGGEIITDTPDTANDQNNPTVSDSNV